MIPHGALKRSATYFIKSNSILKLNSKEKNRGQTFLDLGRLRIHYMSDSRTS